MMYKPMIFVHLLLVVFMTPLLAQEKHPAGNDGKLYHPEANASADLATALAKAGKERKHVLVQVGGNWCSWCLKLNTLFRENARVDSLLQAEFVLVHVNYSKENMNLKLLSRLAYPQRFGFPVLVILDSKGKRLHTQDSGLLESNGTHDPEKVMTVLSQWTRGALDPSRYSAGGR